MAKLQIDGMDIAELDDITAKQIKILVEAKKEGVYGRVDSFSMECSDTSVSSMYQALNHIITLKVGFHS